MIGDYQMLESGQMGQAGKVRGLDRGLRVLSLFIMQDRDWSVKEMAEALDIPLASTYRIVRTLEAAGFLDSAHLRGSYRLGLRLLHLGFVVYSKLDVRQVALPRMKRLAEEVGETVVLMIPRRQYAVCVENVEGSYPIRPRSIAVGERRHYNCGAVALALLAYLADEHREEILKEPLPRLTEYTLTSVDKVRERCSLIRETGVSYSKGEVFLGTAAVASPIFDARGGVVAAVALTGVVERIVDLDDTIRAAAQDISEALGWTPPQS